MASDTIATLRAALLVARAVFDSDQEELAPLIQGMRNLEHLQISAETKGDIDAEIADHSARQSDISDAQNGIAALLIALQRLQDDGYPALKKATVTADVLADIKRQVESVTLAAGEFIGAQLAARVEVPIGSPTPKAKGAK